MIACPRQVMLRTLATTSSCTKHVDIRRKFVREFEHGGVIVVRCVQTEDNDSDIMTENLGSSLHHCHMMNLLVQIRQLLGTFESKYLEGIDDTHFVLHIGCDPLY